MITIIGLGPGDPELITRKAWSILTNAHEVWVRTRRHPAVSAVATQTTVHSYDPIYEQHQHFSDVYQDIANDVIARAVKGDVIYAVPGDPSVAEATTHHIRVQARQQGLAVQIIPGVSFLEPTFAAIDIDPITGVQVMDALDLCAMQHPPGNPQQGLILIQLYSRLLAGDVKLTLMNAYPDDHAVVLVTGAGTANERVQSFALYQLDRHDDFDDLTSLWVPPLEYPATYNALQEIIAHLRSPEGCPWDREQTHLSLRPYLLEETFEVLDALDAEDSRALSEELGDLLIQVALHIQIATEEGEFKLADVIDYVVSKLIRRHPHVFGEISVDNSTDVARNWEAIKQVERKDKPPQTLLDGIPNALPALAQAQTYVERLTRVGYPTLRSETMAERELGRTLFSLVEQAQMSGIDAESALRAMNTALRDRLARIEADVAKSGRMLTDLDEEEQHQLWN